MTREADDLERIIGRTPIVVFHWKAVPGWPVEFVSLGIRRFGYEPEDFYSGRLSYMDLVHPEDRRRVANEVDRHVARGDEAFDQQYRLIGADGAVRWVDDHSSIRRADGTVVGFEGVVLDITERKSFEISERRHQHFEQVLLDALPMPVFFNDTSLVYRGCNQAFAAFVGVPREKVVDVGVHQLWPPELAALYERRDRELLADPLGVQVYEAEIQGADGLRHEVVFHKTTYRDEKGQLDGIVGVIVDVTERNQALRALREARAELEQRVELRTAELQQANRALALQVAEREAAQRRLRESEARFRSLADSLPQMVFETDLDGRLTWFNRIAYKMFGYTPEEAAGSRYALEMVAPEDRERARANMRDILESCGPEHSEYSAVRRDGGRFSILVSSRPILRNGRPAGMRGVIVDISDRVAAERMKDEFLSIASHELRTPLTPLRLLVSQALRRVRGGKPVELESLQKMDRHARQLTELIDDLLDVSRLERGTMVFRPVRLDLRDAVRSGIEPLSAIHPDQPLSIELPEQPVPVLADPTRLEQVLANLLDNAVKYGAGAPVEVRLTVDSGRALLSVTDHGPGISADRQERLFTRFFRAALPDKPGLGLGLYISREIIRLHRGTIGVVSEPGRGATFYFDLPLDDGAPLQTGTPADDRG